MRVRSVVLPILIALLALSLGHTAVEAQRAAPDNQRRAQLEQAVRQRVARMLKERVGLSDEQLEQVGELNRRFEERRRVLIEQERDVRIGLRQEVLREDEADQERVARLLDQAIQVQQERLRVLEEEQRELAKFLTPVQRAKYLAVQEQIHRAVEEMRWGRRPR